jgi:hypothetical protein
VIWALDTIHYAHRLRWEESCGKNLPKPIILCITGILKEAISWWSGLLIWIASIAENWEAHL